MCPLFRELKMSPCFADERTSEPQITSDWQTPKSGVLLGGPVLVLWQRPSPPQIPCAVPRCGGGGPPHPSRWLENRAWGSQNLIRIPHCATQILFPSSEMWGENLNCLYRILSSRISEACQNPSRMSFLL